MKSAMNSAFVFVLFVSFYLQDSRIAEFTITVDGEKVRSLSLAQPQSKNNFDTDENDMYRQNGNEFQCELFRHKG